MFSFYRFTRSCDGCFLCPRRWFHFFTLIAGSALLAISPVRGQIFPIAPSVNSEIVENIAFGTDSFLVAINFQSTGVPPDIEVRAAVVSRSGTLLRPPVVVANGVDHS